ncbi:MAG TPA: (d)CMP kinase [Candidatus Binataceae bacterium]|jgi:cytidylate kinase|nr:(d)CMP kinase [Candidatus Binataceae bacterium]
MSTLFRQMTICGVGLIGGSLAQIARRHGLVDRIVGLGRTQANLDVALKLGLIDSATRDPAQAAVGADLVVLAAPILAMPGLLSAMAPHLPPDAVITDVGSVKGWVVEHLEPLLGPRMALVAAHPVAGKEITGAAAADPELFKGRRVIITPSARSTPQALEQVTQLWLATGARVERMPPDVHDQILARASHLPQLVSSALGAALADEQVAGRYAAAFGAGGLRDTTRLALSSAEMWRDICLTNREAILQALGLFISAIENFRGVVQSGDADAITAALAAGQRIGRHLAAAAPKRRRPIIAIDGPVGAGKSTVARALARELGFDHLNTGAMYRALALAAHRRGISPDDPALEQRLAPILDSIRIEFDGARVLLDGADVSAELTEPAISDLASQLSTLGVVRARMVDLQRVAAAQGGVVMEGRDIGTVVFPDAEVKFYLDGDIKVRAARRFAELKAKGQAVKLAEVEADLRARDRRDTTREIAPLVCAPDAIVINSTNLSVAQVVERLISEIHKRLQAVGGT